MKTVITINRHTGATTKREVLQINKNSIDLAFPEYKSRKQRFYYKPTMAKYYADYPHESFRKENIQED